MKRFITLLLAIAMALSLCACGNSNSMNTSNTENASTSQSDYGSNDTSESSYNSEDSERRGLDREEIEAYVSREVEINFRVYGYEKITIGSISEGSDDEQWIVKGKAMYRDEYGDSSWVKFTFSCYCNPYDGHCYGSAIEVE